MTIPHMSKTYDAPPFEHIDPRNLQMHQSPNEVPSGCTQMYLDSQIAIEAEASSNLNGKESSASIEDFVLGDWEQGGSSFMSGWEPTWESTVLHNISGPDTAPVLDGVLSSPTHTGEASSSNSMSQE